MTVEMHSDNGMKYLLTDQPGSVVAVTNDSLRPPWSLRPRRSLGNRRGQAPPLRNYLWSEIKYPSEGTETGKGGSVTTPLRFGWRQSNGTGLHNVSLCSSRPVHNLFLYSPLDLNNQGGEA